MKRTNQLGIGAVLTLILAAQVAAQTTEGFETGDFSAFPWTHSGNVNWTITNLDKHSGTYSARAGAITHNQSSTLQMTISCPSGNISFWYKMSSESSGSALRFYIGNVREGLWSGTQDWAQVSYAVSAGVRTLRWTYSKSSGSSGADTACTAPTGRT